MYDGWKTVLYDYIQHHNKMDVEYTLEPIRPILRDERYAAMQERRLMRLAAAHRERKMRPRTCETRARIMHAAEKMGNVTVYVQLRKIFDYGGRHQEERVEVERLTLAQHGGTAWRLVRIEPDLSERLSGRYPPEQPAGLWAEAGAGWPDGSGGGGMGGPEDGQGGISRSGGAGAAAGAGAGSPAAGEYAAYGRPAVGGPARGQAPNTAWIAPGAAASTGAWRPAAEGAFAPNGRGAVSARSPGGEERPRRSASPLLNRAIASGPQPYPRQARYNREQAAAYADRWWNSANPDYIEFDVDCTNFVSQSLYAGNAPMNYTGRRDSGWWYQGKAQGRELWSYSWAVANSLEQYLAKSRSGLRGEEVDSPYRLELGDVITYDWDADGRYQHTVIVTAFDAFGNPLVNAHTVNSRHRYWDYRDSYAWNERTRIRFFHIPDLM